jgi:hypothetical protein
MNDFESTEGCSGQGPQGPDGFSAYQIAVFDGFVGTEEEWLASLVGPGVPVGGTAGQILAKINSTNYNTQWINPPSLTGYVPYIGATQALNLGAFSLTANSIIKNGGTSSQYLMADGSTSLGFVLPSLTSGSVLFSNGTTIAQDNSNFFWNNTSKKLGIGTSTFVGSIKLAVNGQIGGPTYSSTYLDVTGAIPELRGNSGIGYYSSVGNHIFYGGSSVEYMRLTTAGNLGIRETSPLTTLDIRTSLNTTITLLSSVPNASTTVLIGNTGTNGVLAIGHNNTAQVWLQGRSRLAGQAAEDILINPLGGNIGIGTTSPTALLHTKSNGVNSNFRAEKSNGTFQAFINDNGVYLNKTYITNFDGNNNYAVYLNSTGAGLFNIVNDTYYGGYPSCFNQGGGGFSFTETAEQILGNQDFHIKFQKIFRNTNLNVAQNQNYKFLNNVYTINNTLTSTGTATGIFLNATETALNGMVHNFIDLQRNSTTLFKITNSGQTFVPQLTFLLSSSNLGSITAMSDGVVKFNDASGGSFGRLQLGGTTNSYPAIKRNGTAIDFRLADDSGFCNLNANSIISNATLTVGSIGNDGTINLARSSNGAVVGAIIQTASISQFHNYQGSGIDFFVTAATNLQRAFVRSTGFGISGTGGGSFTLDASALLQGNSTTQGFLPPRMTNAQRLAIATPAIGLIVYCTDVVEGLYINKSTGWTFIA